MIYKLGYILKLIRWTEWYHSKLPLFFIAYYYLLLIYHKVQLHDMLLLLPLWIFFASLASFGYILNDYFDKSIDRISGKPNAIDSLSDWQQIFALLIAPLIGFIAFIPFYQYKFAVMFVLLSYLFSILYSAYPFRLKEKGVLGITCVSLAEMVFPALIVFGIFEHFMLDTLLFATLYFLIGLRWILVHQFIDRDNDIQANIETFAATNTPTRTYSILQSFFAIELIVMMGLLGVMVYTLSFKMLPLIVAYFAFELYLSPFWKKLGFRHILASYDFAPLANFYFLFLPLWLSILLGCLNPWFFIITAIEILWKWNYINFNIYLIRLRRQHDGANELAQY